MCLTLRSAAAPRRPLHLMVMRSYGAVGSLAASSPHRPSLLPARTSDRIRQHEARLRAVGLECGVGLGPGGVEAANDEGERIDHVRRLLPEPKMEVGNSQAMASRAGLPEDIAALYLLAPLDVGLVQMAVNSRPKDLIASTGCCTTMPLPQLPFTKTRTTVPSVAAITGSPTETSKSRPL